MGRPISILGVHPIGIVSSRANASVFLDPIEVVGNLGVNARHLPGTGGGPERDDADDHPGVVRVEMQQRAPTVSPTSIRLENSKLEKPFQSVSQ